jgi:hypothetical protein
MGLSREEKEKVDNYTFSYQETYRRIAEFYKTLATDWHIMTVAEKSKYRFYPSVDITLTFPYINSLPDESDDLFFVLGVAHLIRSSQKNDKMLEFAYHIKDEHGIKLGMYAEYLIKQFQIIDSFI